MSIKFSQATSLCRATFGDVAPRMVGRRTAPAIPTDSQHSLPYYNIRQLFPVLDPYHTRELPAPDFTSYCTIRKFHRIPVRLVGRVWRSRRSYGWSGRWGFAWMKKRSGGRGWITGSILSGRHPTTGRISAKNCRQPENGISVGSRTAISVRRIFNLEMLWSLAAKRPACRCRSPGTIGRHCFEFRPASRSAV